MIDEKALVRAVKRAMENAGTLPAKEAVKLVPADWHRICAFVLGTADESAKPKEAEGLAEWSESLPKEPTPALREAFARYKDIFPDPVFPTSVKLGSRLTVEGVEAVVVPVEPTRRMVEIIAYHPVEDRNREQASELYSAMLSAAGDGR